MVEIQLDRAILVELCCILGKLTGGWMWSRGRQLVPDLCSGLLDGSSSGLRFHFTLIAENP
jgi:hypothetical protein